MLRMDEINKIRKAFFCEKKSKHSLAIQFNRSWETIDRIVSASREELADWGKRPGSEKRVFTKETLEAVEGYLKEEVEKRVKKKQRYTAKYIFEELKAKGIYTASLRSMQNLVKSLREKYGQKKTHSFLPLNFTPGSALQVDHGEVDLQIDENRVKGYLFLASVPGQALRYCQIFPVKSREAWGEFHERAFQ